MQKPFLFTPEAPLRRHLLVHSFEDGQRHAPLLAQFLKLDERIAAELLGWPACDPQLHGAAQVIAEARRLDELVLPAELVVALRRAAGGAGSA